MPEMQSGGGFIIDDLSNVFEFDATGGRPDLQHKEVDDPYPESVATPKPLTSKQEAKLRTFLDGALEDITRGYRKRFDPSSSLHTLPSYLAEWMRLLGVLAHVPPYGSGSTNLLVSYLLRCSTELCDGVTGYSLAMESEALKQQRKRQKQEQQPAADSGEPASDEGDDTDSDEEEEDRQDQIASRTRQLNLVLQSLDLLDRIWAAVMRGNLINLPVAVSNAKTAFPASTEPTRTSEESSANLPPQSRKSQLPLAIHSTSSLVPSPAIDGRFASSASASSSTAPRESLPIHGGRGNRTVGVTDQIRLRNIAISSRDTLFSWMRSELDAPAPPTMQDDDLEQDEPRDNTVEGALEITRDPVIVADRTEEDEDPDFEDVAIGEQEPDEEEGYDATEDTEEHQHFQDLFDRKIDPDADDDDDDDEGQPATIQRREDRDESDQTLGASVLGTVEAVTSQDAHIKRKRELETEIPTPSHEPRADGLPSKRPRATSTDRDTDVDGVGDNVKMSHSEVGSVDFNLSDAVGQWDIAFTRLFSKTLRTLSDLSDFSKRGGKTDFTSSLAAISGADEQEPADERQ